MCDSNKTYFISKIEHRRKFIGKTFTHFVIIYYNIVLVVYLIRIGLNINPNYISRTRPIVRMYRKPKRGVFVNPNGVFVINRNAGALAVGTITRLRL